jgi:hypothetical protein
MEILQSISLDFGRDTLPITVFAKQNDQKSRFVKITPLNCGQTYTLDSGITARLQLTKPDGHTVIDDATIENNTITAELTAQVLAAAGMAVAEIGLYKNDALLSSQVFYIDIKKAAYDMEAVESSDEYNSLVDALGRVDGAVSDCNAAKDAANTAAETANSAASTANTAAQGANTAAGAANTAATGAERVNISAEQTATGANVTVTNRNGEQTTVHIDTLVAIDSWEDIKNAVRLGLGARLFPVGYEFTTYDSDQSRNIVWVVRDHDHHTAANGRLEHTMTLETKYVYSGSSGSYVSLVFDATEAFYYAESGLAAGTYHFTVANQAWYTADNGKTFQFTLAQAVPAGGQLVLSMTYNATLEGKSVKTYASANSSTVIETATITEGNGGTDLGTTDGTGNMNYMHRSIFGSNNYAQSAARQWLNSAAAAGSVWTPTNKFDRAPSWATSQKGFMHGLPADFLAVVQPAVVPCRTNSVFEVASLDGTVFTTNQVYNLAEKFFLLSRPEIFGDWDSASYKDGTQLEYYEGLTATERIKRDAAGSARNCWLRVPYPGDAHNERFVYTDGSLNSHYAYGAGGVAPACIIA